MWSFKKLAERKMAKMDEDFLKMQIQKKLENYKNTKGPSRFCGLPSVHCMVINFDQACGPDTSIPQSQLQFQSQFQPQSQSQYLFHSEQLEFA